MNKKYPSKVSYGLLIFIFVIFFAPFIFDLIDNGFEQNILVKMVFPIILYGFILYLFFSTAYTIDDGLLKIKFGFFSFRSIDINEITEISKTDNILSSPAPSFDRIEIKYGKFGSVIISPRNKISFTKDLVQLNPKIKSNLIENQ
ncbi:PH domain-containing protein [Marivirga salinae]|uniref:PH domain-containing protein n=1 Tax=Marivirga salinarum TaxID=3059078 RepID=A0AA49GFE0_9BACT|nr:PH domain-containing protein [Marivirga sp. BDSF4-3]WKK77955.1 PH domain-containing protein [Marivirga sp. BDSF4-3]